MFSCIDMIAEDTLCYLNLLASDGSMLFLLEEPLDAKSGMLPRALKRESGFSQL